MGTQLMLAGLEQGNCGEAWNLPTGARARDPAALCEAGSDCISHNTSADALMLNRQGHADKVAEINKRGSDSRGKPSARDGYVIGDNRPFRG